MINRIPINDFSHQPPGDQRSLPYVVQLSPLSLEEEDQVLIESEDLTSAFKLFTVAPAWCPYLASRKRGRGGGTGVKVRPALRVDECCRQHLGISCFVNASISYESETRKDRPIPERKKSLLYLDSFDQIRHVNRKLASLLAGKACGHPVNAGKALAGSLQAGIQGGHLDGDRGTTCLPPDKLHKLVLCILALLTKSQWTKQMLRRWVGLPTFVDVFRRPPFLVFQEIFLLIVCPRQGRVDSTLR